LLNLKIYLTKNVKINSFNTHDNLGAGLITGGKEVMNVKSFLSNKSNA
jgi:hypothetical protein